MADLKTAYGSNGQTITCTLASLASSSTAGRESTVVDNTSNLFLDALVFVQIKTQAGSPASDKVVYIYAYGTVDNGTTYPDAVTGSDAAITMNDPTNVRLLGAIESPTASSTFKGGPWSVASVFGGVLPAKWGIVIRNFTGLTLSATESDHKKLYQGVYSTVV